MSEVEYGTCDICGNKNPLNRKYYRYSIKCECCNGPNDDHFEICFYCEGCVPRPPRMVKCFLQPNKE